MTRRVFVIAWLSFGAALILPLIVNTLASTTNLFWQYDLDFILKVSTVSMVLAPILFGLNITLHTLVTGRFRRLALSLCAAHLAVGLWRLITGILNSAYVSGSMYWDPFEWWWMAAMQITITLIMSLRLITAWAPSLWSRGLRIVALSVLGLTITYIVVLEIYLEFLQRQYIDRTAARGVPFALSLLGVALGAVSLLWSGAERAAGKRWRKLETTVGKHVPVSLACPRCENPMEIKAGTLHRCSKCGVGVEVRVEEPRCSCGYLLYDFEGDVCPECGVEIQDRWRWEAASANVPLGDREPAPGPERG